MIIEFSGKILFWRGPAPWFFVAVPEEQSQNIKAISNLVTYGWGVIPVHVQIGKKVYDFPVSQGRKLSCAHQSQCPQSRKS